MKLFTGWIVSAGLVVMAAAANAQVLGQYETGRSPYAVVSDFEGPYAATPPEVPGPPYGPALLPPIEVYAILRENGFLPLGIPRQRGLVYTIAVMGRGGDDGRLVIDARNGRIIRFVPAYRMGDNFNEDLRGSYGAVGSLPPLISTVRGPPRPPASIPHVASRTPSVPVPRAAPPRSGEAKPLAAESAPAPTQQSAAVQAKPANPQTPPQVAAPATVEPKPAAPQIQPTQEMPKVQGLD
jgi:hypothetical protein